MSTEFYSSVIESILANSQMSQEATLTYKEDGGLVTETINGLFSSGTYSEDAPSVNAPKRSVRGDCFVVSRTQLTTLGITNPSQKLRKATLVIGSDYFLVLEVRGALNEMITLSLRPTSNPSDDEEC